MRVVLHSYFDMAIHVATLNQVEATALVFDTRFTGIVDAHRKDMATVKLFVALGPNPPAWAVSYDAVLPGGEAGNPLVEVDDEAPNFLQLTTGTTGRPKPWVMTFRSWRAVIQGNTEHFDTFGGGSRRSAEDVSLHFHPLQWATGFQTLFPYFLRGARTVLLDDESFDPVAIVDAIAAEGVTGLFTPGPMLTPILDEIEKRETFDPKIRRLMVFIATPEQLNRATRLIGPIWAHGFGSTEQGAPSTRLIFGEAAERRERLGSVGRVISPFHEIRIADEHGETVPPGEIGEIVVRSPMSTSSYWNMPEQTSKAFFPGQWFRPRDIGYIDRDGFLFYLDRATDRIATSSGVVYPHVEAASVLTVRWRIPQVVGLGAADVQEVVAAVLLKSGTEASNALSGEILTIATGQLVT